MRKRKTAEDIFMHRHDKRNQKGFTLAETLMTVAILVVLFGLIFIGVIYYLRRMAQVERDGIAKEIFVSAQNHLTMAESQGYLGRTNFGTKEEGGEGAEVYFYAVDGAGSFGENTVLELMLPFGSVDETVRIGGTYIVRYQKDPALVLDVFYCPRTGSRFGHTLTAGDYSSAMALRSVDGADHKRDRRYYGSDRAVLGWYGGEDAHKLEKGKKLEDPAFELINAEKLKAVVKDPNADPAKKSLLKLIVTGQTSGAKKAFTLSPDSALTNRNIEYDPMTDTYTVILDDVTTPGLHFSELFDGDGFIAGENIIVQAVAFSNQVLTNIAYSGEKKTNSLFEDITPGEGSQGTAGMTARVNNLRHLENLDPAVSDVNADGAKVSVSAGLQTSDLDWKVFQEKILDGSTGQVKIYKKNDNTGTKAGCYLPVSPGYVLDYDGQRHNVKGILADRKEDAGLFGTLEAESKIKDLMLVDCSITSTEGAAGTLAGSVKGTGAEITNVLARGAESAVKGGGSAGGLVGSVGSGTFTGCGAAVLVSSTGGDAGGLIGNISGGTVSGCYAGGHTSAGRYDAETDGYNVASSGGNAGGLAGDAGSARISASYSTCSVSGATSGGLVGASGGRLENCYVTGLVQGSSAAGAVAGSYDGAASGCLYLEIINERITGDSTIEYMTPIGGGAQDPNMTAMDADTAAYTAFVGDPEGWESAGAYDAVLIEYFKGKYSYKTVTQLEGGPAAGDNYFVNVHYGDWPAPEILFLNQ